MEQKEIQKNLEKKRAYLHFTMIFIGLLIPTLFSVFKKINMNWPSQLGIYAVLALLIFIFQLMSKGLENKLAKARTEKK